MKRRNVEMHELYEEYKESLKSATQVRNKRQRINKKIRELHKSPFSREDYNDNKNDITNWNSMIRDLEEDMKLMEMYLDFDCRTLLHRDYNNMKSMILNKNSYEGEVPLDDLYDASIPDTTDVVCDVELQEEIIELLSEVLTQRQKQVVDMYYWQEMTQEQIAKKLGLTQRGIGKILENSLKLLRDYIKFDEIVDFI